MDSLLQNRVRGYKGDWVVSIPGHLQRDGEEVNMAKLSKDFGVRALFGCLLIAPVSFAIIWATVFPGAVGAVKELAGVIGAWVMAVIIFYYPRNNPPAP